jgi:hypothetical protein
VTVTIEGITFEDLDAADAYWDAVANKEQAARAKAARLPPCRHCGRPLWLAQDRWNGTAHRICTERKGP